MKARHLSIFLSVMTMLFTACVEIRTDESPSTSDSLQIERVNDNARPDEVINLLNETDFFNHPFPNHSADSVDINTVLRWSAHHPENASVVYGVLLGANDPTPDEFVCAASPIPLCDPPETLAYNTHYYWQVFSADSAGKTKKGPVWEFTTIHDPGLPFFSDDFSSDIGWVNESHNKMLRDPTREILVWESKRSQPRAYYIPIRAISEKIRLSFRINLLAAGGNGNVYFGLAESLDGAENNKNFPPGFFINILNSTEAGPHIRHYITHSSLPLDTLIMSDGCQDMTCAPSEEYLLIESWGIWYRIELTIDGNQWFVRLFDDSGNDIDSMTGVTNNTHNSYSYLMLFNELRPSWEWLSGYLDDVELYATPVSVKK